eukprot:TRINITY_DN6711_c0_g1_i2.p2 TRINITY_DN6711_c0_g1~~TRINITY_DN6711_c0_g1_i2.p2  ORF type:complete len:304 (-),score=45.00 TRINITY_DN6711_c0_g1_i2:460-1371(-)
MKGDLPCKRDGVGCVSVGNVGFVVGGRVDGNVTASCLKRDFGKDDWTEFPEYPVATMMGLGITVLGDVIYGSGGNCSLNTPSDCFARFDPREGKKWDKLPKLLSARQDHSLIGIGKNLHIIGGQATSGTGCLEQHVFDTTANSWRKDDKFSKNLQNLNSAASLLTPADGIYLFGGTQYAVGGNLKTVQYFDPATIEWIPKKELPGGLVGARAVALGDDPTDPRIFVIGGSIQVKTGRNHPILGNTRAQDTDVIHEYSPIENKWKTSAIKLSGPKSGFGCITLQNKVFIIGGTNSASVEELNLL